MNLILTRHEKAPSLCSGMGALFYAWLWFNRIDIGVEGIDFRIDYNEVHHFYDLELFHIPGNQGDPGGHIPRVIAFLEFQGYQLKTSDSTWRWEGLASGKKKKIPGTRLFITPKAAPKEQ